jgi:hypothetical protein
MDFLIHYLELEKKFRRQAHKDGDIFLPNFRPESPVDVVLVGAEPSLGHWAKDDSDAQAQIEAGFRNFSYSFEDFVLHFSVRRFFLHEGETYHLTDISKGAMRVERAAQDRELRYERWSALLKEEIDLVAKPGAPIVAIGRPAQEALSRNGIGPVAGTLLHYSGQAARHRKAAALAQPAEFQKFLASNPITVEEILATTEGLFAFSNKPLAFASRIARMRSKRRSLSDSIRHLMFTYFVCLGEIRSRTDSIRGRPNQALQPTAAKRFNNRGG